MKLSKEQIQERISAFEDLMDIANNYGGIIPMRVIRRGLESWEKELQKVLEEENDNEGNDSNI